MDGLISRWTIGTTIFLAFSNIYPPGLYTTSGMSNYARAGPVYIEGKNNYEKN